MKLFKRHSRCDAAPASWADLCFERTRPHVRLDECKPPGCVAVLLPRTGIPLLDRLARRMGARDHRLRLDEIGSFVWLRLDGRHSVEGIARELAESFGERVEPVDQTLVRFLQSLRRGGAIKPREEPATGSE